MKLSRVVVSVLLLLAEIICQAGVSITCPLNRCVFQRDKSNNAAISIAGNFTEAVDRVEARLVPVAGGVPTDWTTIQNQPAGGFYQGSLVSSGGWFQLEVRGIRGDQVAGSALLPRVGVGEVFMVAGQSNGQGFLDYGAPGAADDRVNCINYYNLNDPYGVLPFPEFSQLVSNAFIAPRGNSAWSWGRLGDILAARLDVPILFYNVAWYGSAARNWQESIDGIAYSLYTGEPYLPYGMPYGDLRTAIQQYVAMTGLRAVLWLQGEAELTSGNSADNYFAELSTIISQSRMESGRNISWVVSRTSYTNPVGIYLPAIEGQNRIIAEVPNVFGGPNTDEIQTPRPDGVHFSGSGLLDLAEAWAWSLDDYFFAFSEPSPAISVPEVAVSCAGDNRVRLSLRGGDYQSLQWSNGSGSGDIDVGEGVYRAKVRDQRGNQLYTPEVRIEGVIQPSKPSVLLPGGPWICEGAPLVLQSSSDQSPVWNTGQNGGQISVTSPGSYSVRIKSIYGCEAVSDAVSVEVSPVPPPSVPAVAVFGATTFCAGGEVVLRASSGPRSEWSEQSRGADLAVGATGVYTVRAYDDYGCYSKPSEPVAVTVHALPAKPMIQADGQTEFCDGGRVVLSSSHDQGNIWSDNSTSRSITVLGSGIFSVRVRDGNGCENLSDPVTVKVNPLPVSPTVTSLRATIFCQNDYTILQSDQQPNYQWSNGGTSREIEVRSGGGFWVTTTDEKGCVSRPSVTMEVVVNPLPARPSISANGPTTFCADKEVVLESTPAAAYQWSDGSAGRTLRLNREGVYTVTVANEFGCLSEPADQVSLQVLALPPTPAITASGSLRFCDGGTVSLVAGGVTPFLWSNGIETDTIVVHISGDYYVQSKGANGCLSLKPAPVKVEVKENPPTPAIRRAGVYTLVAEPETAGRFQWEANAAVLAGESPFIKVTRRGAYQVKAFRVYDEELVCTSEYSEVFEFVPGDGSDAIVLYPNPSRSNQVYVELVEDWPAASVTLFDAAGRLVRNFGRRSFSGRIRLEVTFLAAGIYYLRVSEGSGASFVKKLVIER